VDTNTVRVIPAVCEECGSIFERSIGRRKARCPRCATARVFHAADEQIAKAGPSYERTVVKQLAYWQGEAVRLGISG